MITSEHTHTMGWDPPHSDMYIHVYTCIYMYMQAYCYSETNSENAQQ